MYKYSVFNIQPPPPKKNNQGLENRRSLEAPCHSKDDTIKIPPPLLIGHKCEAKAKYCCLSRPIVTFITLYNKYSRVERIFSRLLRDAQGTQLGIYHNLIYVYNWVLGSLKSPIFFVCI